MVSLLLSAHKIRFAPAFLMRRSRKANDRVITRTYTENRTKRLRSRLHERQKSRIDCSSRDRVIYW